MKTKNFSGKKGPQGPRFKKKQSGPKSRKEQRKELRKSKKNRQQQHILNKFGRNKGEKTDAVPCSHAEVSADNQSFKQINEATLDKPVIKKSLKKNKSSDDGPVLSMQSEKRRLNNEMGVQRIKQLHLANKEEDKNIKKLEKMLKMNRRKSKNLPKAFVDDGLDYLLEVCDPAKLKTLSQDQAIDASSGSDFEDDLADVTGKSSKSERKRKSSNSSDQEHSSDSESDIDQEMTLDESDCSPSESEQEDEESDHAPKSSKSSKKSKVSDQVVMNKNKQFEENYSESEKDEDDEVAKTSKNKKKVKFIDIVPSIKNKKIKKLEKQESDMEDAFEDGDMGSSDESLGTNNEEMNSNDEGSDQEKDPQSDYWEDIYGRKRDKQGNIVQATSGRYVPPALRASAGSDNLKLQRLKRQMQGLLNRVAESNMSSVASQLESIIMSHSRGDASEVLGQLLLAALASSHSQTPTKLVAENAVLLAMLHAHVGSEMGASFLQTTVKIFDEVYEKNEHTEDKMLNNLILILCFMYCFKIFHCTLIFDIIKKLSEMFKEKDVELLLLILKTVGPSLRKDDPATLKDVILQLQKQASASTLQAENSRVRFMLDVVLAIKNNNMSRIPDYDPDLVDHLRKLLRGLLRSGAYVSELKISLDDLLNAEERGRWWVVGSAWQGSGPTTATTQQSNQGQNFSQKLLELARKQRMNTDTRKNIFCILMTAEDYLDAFEKLLHLGLKGQQEREISYVILDCCLQEKTYNAYYYHLSQKFCEFDRKHRMALQCSIWDKIKELPKLSLAQLRNLASITSQLILGNGLPLSVLKVIQFADLEKNSIKFVRQVLLKLLLSESDESCVEAFCHVASSAQLSLFREGLCIFLHKYILKKEISSEDSQLLRTRVSLAERALTNAESKLAF